MILTLFKTYVVPLEVAKTDHGKIKPCCEQDRVLEYPVIQHGRVLSSFSAVLTYMMHALYTPCTFSQEVIISALREINTNRIFVIEGQSIKRNRHIWIKLDATDLSFTLSIYRKSMDL